MALEGLYSFIYINDAANSDDTKGGVYYNISLFINLIIRAWYIYLNCIRVIQSKLLFN
jgi:hypothetical protein